MSRTIAFEVSGRPESAGLRIKSTKPCGVYVSCADAAEAQGRFEAGIAAFVHRNELLPCPPGGAIGLAAKIDWDDAIARGGGEAQVTALSAEWTTKFMEGAEPVAETSSQSIVEWWEHPENGLICVCRDSGDYADEWIDTAIMEDFG